jgi:hypothetical protein
MAKQENKPMALTMIDVMAGEVFCKECIFLFKDSECTLKLKEPHKTWYSKNSHRDPSEVNKNNDCPDYCEHIG